MKKGILFALLCIIAIVLSGCKDPLDEKNTVENKYAIGKTGPGGGTIYYYDSFTGNGKEVSENFGLVQWLDVESLVTEHNKKGFNNWIFPTKEDLNELWEAKCNHGILQDENRNLWSSTEDEIGKTAWVYEFGDSYLYILAEEYNPNAMGEITTNGVRLIRSFTVSSL